MMPFLFGLEAERRSDEMFLAGEVCEMHLLVWNKKKHEKTIVANIHFIVFWFCVGLTIFILRFSQN